MGSSSWRPGLLGLALLLGCAACGAKAPGPGAALPMHVLAAPTEGGGRPTRPPWPRPDDARQIALVKEAGLTFMPSGHTRPHDHIHAHLIITYDGHPVTVPANIGIVKDRYAVIHTHDRSGSLHIEGRPGQVFTLGQFFAEWGIPLEGAEVAVLGQAVRRPAALRLANGQVIRVVYTSR